MESVKTETPWGPTGELVYRRSYRRIRPDGSREEWPDTVRRVIDGNLGLVPVTHHEAGERDRLEALFLRFAALPAGRHLWMSGVSGRQFLFNCHVAGWDGAAPSQHFSFLFNQLMQGGGVGANYSNRYLARLPKLGASVELHLVCDRNHVDHAELAPYLSAEYSPHWPGSIRVEDTRGGWVQALRTLLDAYWGGRRQPLVFDLTLLRPRGAPIRTFGGTASGPQPLATLLTKVVEFCNTRSGATLSSLDAMTVDHWIAEAVVAGNVRRSARMSMKHWADADLADFLKAKRDPMLHWSTNISVEVDADFFAAIGDGDAHAAAVLEGIVEGMLRNGEPGVWNRTAAQVGERKEVVCTNPCGEIALEEWENCNLGHINLTAFADDPEGALEAHRLMTRFLLRATFGDVPDPSQQEVLARNRRIGVGHFGFQGFLLRSGIRYSEAAANSWVRHTLKRFASEVRAEARRYAAELGVPEPVKATTVAPTGSIAKLPGATEGIQPIYARYFVRRVRLADTDPEVEALRASGYGLEPDIYSERTVVAAIPTKDALVAECELRGTDGLIESADELRLETLLGVQAMYQAAYADNAVSMTINLPTEPEPAYVSDVLLRYLPRLKGTTLMVDQSRPQAPYERISRDQYELSAIRTIDALGGACIGDACPIGNEGLL